MSEAPNQCPLCRAPSPRALGRTHVDEGTTYSLYECDACGVQFWDPLKNPGAQWYSRHERYGNRNRDPVWTANWNHRKAISYLSPMHGAVLDVGCGIGNFLEIAKNAGWDCAGVDFDPDAIEAAKKRTGLLDLHAQDVISYAAEHPAKKFDLVTFFDVLEHVDNHNEFIGTIRALLKDDGYVAMSMPYRKHALWLMEGDVPPVHLTCWSRSSLKKFLEARGFAVVYMARRSEGIWNIVMKLRFRFGESVSFNTVGALRKSIGDSGTQPGKRPLLVRIVHRIAKAKDGIIFGIPAIIVWIVMLPTPRRYVTLYAIARKTSK